MKANRIASRSSMDRLALLGTTLLGMALCTPGIGRVAASGQWLSAQGIIGSALGVAVLGVVGARLLGRPLPMIATDRTALVAVVTLAAVKVIVSFAVPLGT